VKAGRRNAISLYVDILRAIGSGARKSRIVYEANMNFGRCGRYLDELVGMGLIKVKTDSPPTWAVTDRGHEFLRKYEELEELLAR